MNGVAGDGSIPVTASTFIGTDLTAHHPVGIEYDASIIKNFDIGSRGMELKTVPDAPLKLYEYGGKKYVECSSCHDPHKENSKFLRVDTGANHAQNVVTTCTSCHVKDNWVGSIHQTATATYTDAGVLADYGTSKVSDLGCINCHTPHNGEGTQYLTRKVQAYTCFQGASADVSGAACHGTGGAKDIETVLNRTYVHPVIAGSDPANNQHTNLDVLYGTGVNDPSGAAGIAWDTNKHVMCMDCHNQHEAQAGTHVTDGSWYGAPGTSTNAVSNVLKGVPGIEPSWPIEWTQPITFSTLKSADKEYQICLKCHSYWGLGSATGGVNDAGYVSQSDNVTPLTDVAWEMNINNKSAHPVVTAQINRTGSYSPKELDATQLLTPWKENPGLNVMYCSDCHGADNELSGDPKGPHGSDLRFLLKGVNQYWPYGPDGVLYDLDDISAGTTGIFCANCHDLNVPHEDWGSFMASQNFNCVACHVAVPHGSPISRMLGYTNFPSPYNYYDPLAGSFSLHINGFRKNGVTDINRGDMNGDGSCNARPCHYDDSANGAYDVNPYP